MVGPQSEAFTPMGALFLNVFISGIHWGENRQSFCQTWVWWHDNIHTLSFRRYIWDTITHPSIAGHLRKHRVLLYMIVGVSVCHSATATCAWSRERTGGLTSDPQDPQLRVVPRIQNSKSRERRTQTAETLTINETLSPLIAFESILTLMTLGVSHPNSRHEMPLANPVSYGNS